MSKYKEPAINKSNPIPPAPAAAPKANAAAKFISNLKKIHEMSCVKDEGKTACRKIAALLAPVLLKESIISESIFSNVSEKAFTR